LTGDLTIRLFRFYTFLLRQTMRIVAISALALFVMAGVTGGLFVAYGIQSWLFKPPEALLFALCILGALAGGYYGWPSALWRAAQAAEVRIGPRVLWRRMSAPRPVVVTERGNAAGFAALKARLQPIAGSEKYDGREQLLRDPRDGATWRYRYIEGDFYHDEEFVKLSTEDSAVVLAALSNAEPTRDPANKA
jgi:hypothetical protein